MKLIPKVFQTLWETLVEVVEKKLYPLDLSEIHFHKFSTG